MKIATAFSTRADSASAIEEAYQALKAGLDGALPQLIVVHSSIGYDGEILMQVLKRRAPGAPIHGGTSCVGVMTDVGFHSENGKGLAILGIVDPEGSYGVGVAALSGDPRAAAYEASRMALEQANRPGEIPSMAWITGAPGSEEAVLKGIGDFFGPNVPIGGGSSADDSVSANWRQFANGEVFSDSIVVSALFASKGIAFSFHSGYDPTDRKAKVTKGGGRVIQELDNLPAAEVYNEWLGGKISEELSTGGNILMKSSLNPMGRVVGSIGGMPYYQLSHPETVGPENCLTMFSEAQVGDEMHLMRGSPESLINRAERVVKSAIRASDVDNFEIAGALIIYCAGCMLTVKDQMPEVVAGLRRGLGKNVPFLGAFTFGEQGCFLGGENRHGNLMISVLLLRS